jgi:leader peptidase (prepilin peptidase)/N-methyltransferase
MDPLFATAIFAFGLAFGSFLNVCIHRIPRRIELQDQLEQARSSLEKLRAEGAPEADSVGQQAEIARLSKEVAGFGVVQPHSACPKCHEPIRPHDNIPVISWLVLGGKCRNCKAPISPRYIAVELLTGVLFLLSYSMFGKSSYTFSPASNSFVWVIPVIKYSLFSFLIVGLTFIDAEWKLLPDVFTIPGLITGLLFSLFVPVLDLVYFSVTSLPRGAVFWPLPWPTTLTGISRIISLCDSLLGAAVGAGFFYFVAVAYKRVRGREGMGFGDVKLMAMVGAFLGVRLTVLTIFGASLVGSAFGLVTILVVWNRRTERRIAKCRESREVARRRAWKSARLLYRYYGLPFGVFLGPMALLSLFLGNLAFGLYWRVS